MSKRILRVHHKNYPDFSDHERDVRYRASIQWWLKKKYLKEEYTDKKLPIDPNIVLCDNSHSGASYSKNILLEELRNFELKYGLNVNWAIMEKL